MSDGEDWIVPEVAVQTVDEHVSAGGRLGFLVVADGSGETALGFDGCPSH